MCSHLLHISVEGQEEHGAEPCKELGWVRQSLYGPLLVPKDTAIPVRRFNQPDCTDCDRIGDYIKDEGASISCVKLSIPYSAHWVFAPVAGLIAECHGCCTQTKNDIGIKFRSAVLEVCSHRLRFVVHITLQKYTQDLSVVQTLLLPGMLSCSTCCFTLCREFPHVETFLKERISSYPNMKVKYFFGAPPRLNLKAGAKSETIRIDHWKTEHIEEYLKDKLLLS